MSHQVQSLSTRMSSATFQFIAVSADGAKDPSTRRSVRAHAARNVHTRRQRVAKYQSIQALARLGAIPDPPLILGADGPDPFDSFHRSLAPLEKLFLDYFFRHVVAYDFSGLPCMGPEPENPGSGALNHDTGFVWTQAALADPGMLASILLVSCRSLSNAQNRRDWDRFAIGYKVEALRDVQRSIAREGSSVSEVTLTKTLALASEEFFSGNSEAADYHLRAAVHMVRLRKSPHTLAMWKNSNNAFLWGHTEELLEDGTSIVLHYHHEPAYCVNPNPDPRVTHIHTETGPIAVQE